MNFWDERFAKEGALWGTAPSVGAQYAKMYFEKKGVRSVLDVACGYGRDSVFLAKKFEVTGIDSSAEGIRRAGGNAMREGVAARFVLGDVRMMPLLPDSFDAVLCNGILSHFLPDERKMVAREIGRVLRKGGCLVISEFSIGRKPEDGKEVDAKDAGEKGTFREQDGMVHHYFGKGELQNLFSAISFEHIEEKTEARREGRGARVKWVMGGIKT